MGRAGVPVDEAIPFSADGVGAVARQLSGVLKSPEFAVAPGTSTTTTAEYVFTRSYRPVWSLIFAVLLAPTLVGLLLLLVKAREQCRAALTADLGGVTVRLSGRLPAARLAALRGLAAGRVRPGRPAAVSTTLDGLWVDGPPGQPAGATAAVRLVFDTGAVARTSAGTGVVGRDPEPEPGERVDQIVTIADASVSKTHFGFGVDWLGSWIVDRYSRNGCVIVDASGSRTRCEPGQRVPIRPGMTLVFGQRSCAIESDG